MAGKNPPNNPPDHKPSQGDTATKGFKFQFQDDCANKSAKDDANPKEAEANKVIARMRQEDDTIFKQHPSPLSPGAHFLHVRDVLEEARLFQMARLVPKGAHLHLHFNSMLLPGVLLGYAKDMVNMYIWSDRRLCTADDLRNCKLEFSLRNLQQVRKEMRTRADELKDDSMQQKLADAEDQRWNEAERIRKCDELGPNIFSFEYKRGKKEEMRYQYFRELWDEKKLGNCDDWLISKLTFSKEEVDSFFKEADDVDLEAPSDTETRTATPQSGPAQPTSEPWDGYKITKEKISNSDYKRNRNSARKAWRAFNGRTKMMKGLFNYETAFRRYTRECLEEFVKDNVQYAEIRPNFMQTNQIFDDGAEFKIDNFGTMKCIIEEYEKFMKDVGDMGDDGKIIDHPQHRPTFSGMKVIYCTPRSFTRDAVEVALNECIAMKEKWPDYIAGFDLVGEEAFAKPYPLKYFEKEFQAFRKTCEDKHLNIPFLFHCGETPDDLEGNLETALELDSRRIGHGYALPKKPKVLMDMKNREVCVETCPISNMVLGLAERMDEHSVYRLLEEKMHCAVSSDNGTLFKSTLSHDFYEVMAGNQNINLYGWKQLAIWSIQHSCLNKDESRRMLVEWEKRWEDFINAITEASGPGKRLASAEQLRRVAEKAEATRLAKLGNANGNTSTARSSRVGDYSVPRYDSSYDSL
ncbi:Metallo-dependent hydrolase [Xylariaceae sp. AK1471]|nr:Metallo-dependent hydrolase [Xylariaceae sp. AK1471]